MADSRQFEFNGPKHAQGGTRYCTLTNPETGRTYHFVIKDDQFVYPTTSGATDEEGLTAACERVEAEGYTVDLDRGNPPAGFQY